MSLRAEMSALRLGVGLCRQPHVHALRVRGEDAFELLDAVSPRPLFVRDGQMLPTVLLNDDGSIFADVYVCADDLDLVLLYEGPEPAEMLGWLGRYVDPSWSLEVVDLSASHELLGVHGPYAWELMAEAVGPEVVGVGYLRSFAMFEDDAICFRAGRTGEFGYEILVPVERAEALRERLWAFGRSFDAAELSLTALDLAALENGFFSMRSGCAHLTPVELQLLWRVTWDRRAPGLDAVRARRSSDRRISWFHAEGPVEHPDVLCVRESPLLGGVTGLVLLPLEDAVPDRRLGTLTTFAPPRLRNRSLFIDAQRHSWAGRALDEFPVLVP